MCNRMPFDPDRFVADFNAFFSASHVNATLEHFSSMCASLQIDPKNPRQFLDKARICTSDARLFRLKSLVQKFDKRFSSQAYVSCRGSAVENANVLIVGSGPAGLRTAIECIFLGCKSVAVIEKRTEFSRNNIVHLWSFVIRDLIELGAKIFFPKFCTGDLDHISIKLFQLILLKISLLLGIRFYMPCEFVTLDTENLRPIFNPQDHELSTESFDVIVGGSGARTVLPGFQFAEDRRALAIGITANFKNKNSLPEQQASEISGVARQFNAQFFDELNSYSGIDIENLVYYKGDTHYFVCTARKASLLMKGVLVNDFPDADRLFSKSNVSQYNLCNYMRELANICTAMTIPDLEYEFCGESEDTAVFDFTSSCYAKHASRAIVRPDGRKLLMCLVGDSLRLPFWPEGTGCPRGFLSSYDTAWLIQNWFTPEITPIEAIALRECVYGLYSSTKPDVLYKNFTELERFHLDPQNRYRQLDLSTAHVHLPKARALIDGVVIVPENPFAFLNNNKANNNGRAMNGRNKRTSEGPRSNQPGAIPDRLYKWCLARLREYSELLPELDKEISFFDGMALCCLLHSIRPSAIDLFAITPGPLAVETFLNAVFREFTIAPQLTAAELMAGSHHNALVRLLLQLYSITTQAEKIANASTNGSIGGSKEGRTMNVAEKAEKLKEMGRGIRQQRKHQLQVEQLLFGGKELTLEEKKLKLKELFLLGQANATNSGEGPSPTSVTAVTHVEFEERKSRLRNLLDPETGAIKSESENAKTIVEMSESLRDRRDLLVRKLLSGSNDQPAQKSEPLSASKISSLLLSANTYTSVRRNEPMPTGGVDVSQTTKKLLTSLSSTCITDEQKALAAACFEARLKGQRRRTSFEEQQEYLKLGPPPVRNVPHLTVGDRKRQLINNNKGSVSRSTKPTPDESAHIPVLELKDRLGIACDTFALHRSADPVEKSQMPISELAKRIATSTSANPPPDRRPEYQIVNQDYQPCCYVCSDRLYVTERMQVGSFAVHRDCFRCVICRHLLRWTCYAAVENEKSKRTIFVCPSHVENNEVEEYFARTSEKIGEIRIENSRKASSQVASPVEEMPPAPIAIRPAVQNVKVTVQPPPKRLEKVVVETCESEEELFFDDDEEDDSESEDESEELEGSVCSETEEEIELEELESDEKGSDQDHKESLTSSIEHVLEDHDKESVAEKASIVEKRDEQTVEMRGALKIDSWLHNQLVQQRQKKLIAAKQAFLANVEPTHLPLPISPVANVGLNLGLNPSRCDLEMECDSDAAVEESSDHKNGSDEDAVDKLAKDYVTQLVVTASKDVSRELDTKEEPVAAPLSPTNGSGVRNMFSKLTRSLEARLSKNRSPPSTSPNPPHEAPEEAHQTSGDDHHSSDDHHDESGVPKWRRFANSLFSGHWPRSQRSNSTTSTETNYACISPSHVPQKAKTNKSRPDSVIEMLYGPNGDDNSARTAAEEVVLASSERRKHRLKTLSSDEDVKANNPVLVREAIRLAAELDKVEADRGRIEEEIVLIERAHHYNHYANGNNAIVPQPLQDAFNRRAEVAKRHSDLLLKAKIIETEAEMDDLMRKYVQLSQGSISSVDHHSPEELMHQIAVLAGNRDILSQHIASSSNEGASSSKNHNRHDMLSSLPQQKPCTSVL